MQTHDIDSMRLEPALERDAEPPLPGFEGLIEGWTPVYPADKD